jgi:hypothetical protein
VDQAVASGGSYEVLARRLDGQGQALETLVRQLNEERLEEFGRSQMEVVGRMRVRTENNCLGRDIAQVGGYLLFGYNVFMGLKQSTRVEDVFGLYRLHEGEQGYEVTPVDLKDSFLGIQSFVQDFQELYAADAAGRARRQAAGELPDRRAPVRRARVPLVRARGRPGHTLHRQPRRARHRAARAP